MTEVPAVFEKELNLVVKCIRNFWILKSMCYIEITMSNIWNEHKQHCYWFRGFSDFLVFEKISKLVFVSMQNMDTKETILFWQPCTDLRRWPYFAKSLLLLCKYCCLRHPRNMLTFDVWDAFAKDRFMDTKFGLLGFITVIWYAK